MLIPIPLLLVQGTSCLRGPEAPSSVRWMGLFTIVLAGLYLLVYSLLRSAMLVHSPEFGLVLVQGSEARFGLCLLLIGLALSAGMGWQVMCLRGGRPRRFPWLVGIGGIVGLLAAARVVSLNPDDAEPFRVYAYDLWWPPLLIWLSICLVDSGLIILRLGHFLGRMDVASVLMAGLAFWALRRPEFGDPRSQILWSGCLLTLLPFSMGLAIWLTLHRLRAGSNFFPPMDKARPHLGDSLGRSPR
jgi:hypothetical protein